MPSLTRRLFLVSLNCAPFALSKSWDAPAFPSWSAEFIDKLLTDSPWASPSDVRVELPPTQRLVESSLSSFQQIELPAGIGLPRTGSRIPGGQWPGRGPTTGSRIPPTGGPTTRGDAGSGTKAEIYLITRWASALPIRRARALQQFGREGLQKKEAVELVTERPAEYVIEIAGFPTTLIRQGASRFEAELKDSARLSVPGRRPIRATSAHVPEHGMHLMTTLSFPRFEELQPKDEYVELSAKARGMQLRERFKLKEMVYGGDLEL